MRRSEPTLTSADAAELAAYRRAIVEYRRVMADAAIGGLESRIAAMDGAPGLPEMRDLTNTVLDLIDGYVRESQAVMASAASGVFHRRFLVQGLPGALRDGAERIEDARLAMQRTKAAVDDHASTRAALADEALGVSGHVAAASTELGASANSLAELARSGVGVANAALATVQQLETSSAQIQEAVTLIKQVTARTRLLALNATIEAARAGDAGRGFAVVASEVKTLSDESTRSSDDISRQVVAAQQAAEAAGEAIAQITEVIHEMNTQIEGIAVAAGGDQGLSSLAEALRTEIGRFAELSDEPAATRR